MAVYTEVSFDEAKEFLARLQLGTLQGMLPCSGGIENTNYFVSTEREGERLDLVLTLFERLTFEQLPFYLHLMKHLAGKGIPVPDPAPDGKGQLLHKLKGKPAAVVNRLQGRSELAPTADHCSQVGAMLARMHLAGQDYPREQPNLRALPWWNETIPVVMPHVAPEQAALLRAELAYQNHIAASPAYAALPKGPVHADLFRDNVMFHHGQLSGFFDFYFAGWDHWVFDLAVCVNDWCIDLDTGHQVPERVAAMCDAYAAVRPLTAAERGLWPGMLRAGALRFWVSRLWDWYLPRDAAMLKPHDPTHFERVLRALLQGL